MAQPSRFPGLYWWRDGRKVTPYLTLVYVGAQGLMVRVVDTSHSSITIWNSKSVDRPLETFKSGEWAGPLGARREEQIIPYDES